MKPSAAIWYNSRRFAHKGKATDYPRGEVVSSRSRRRVWVVLNETTMCMLDEIRAKRDEIYAIARKHKAEKLWVFGSCARKEERPDSDIDLLVKFSPDATFKDFVEIERKVGSMFGRGVDVVENTAIRKNPCFAWQVCPEAVAI